MGNQVDWNGVLVSYIGLPLFLILWAGYKFSKKTKLIPLDKCDLEV
jgi:lysine-specific permease